MDTPLNGGGAHDMRIGLNGLALDGRSGGVPRLTLGMIKGLARAASRRSIRKGSADYSFEVVLTPDGLAAVRRDEELNGFIANERVTVVTVKRPPLVGSTLGALLLEQFLLRRFAKRRKWSVLQSFDYHGPVLSPVPQCIVLTDLQYLDNSSTFGISSLLARRVLVPRSIRSAATVFAISRATLIRARQAFPEACGKVVVTPLGYDYSHSRVGPKVETNTGPDSDAPLLLTVGALRRYKNHDVLLRALALPAFERHHLCIVGRDGGQKAHLVEHAKRLGVDRRVQFVTNLGDDELERLYRRATVVVAPSLYEGFGLTVLEAMAVGTPIACSDIPAHKEVAAGIAEFFDPREPESVVGAVDAAVKSQAEVARAHLRKERLESFTWLRCGEALLAAYDRLTSHDAGL